jgi:amino acid adenylation domain-containing protein
MIENFNIATPFHDSACAGPDRLALAAGGREVTYGALADTVARLAGHLGTPAGSGRIGILATRSVEAYAGILAAGWCGGTYVPLNLKWPEERLVALLEALELEALVVDANGAALLTPTVLEAAPKRIVVADAAAPVEAPAGTSLTRFADLRAAPMAAPAPVGPDHVAYIIFTSGTTGMPKGVVISAGSLAHYLEKTRPWTRFTPSDRVAETCDVTFDLTVHNLFLAFAAGSSLHVLSPLEMLAPARFVRSRECTVWLSVPTLIALMRGAGALKPGLFPSLRLSIFCGEPLPIDAVRAWAEATPNGVVENIYGPTEGTVICMRQTLSEPAAVTPKRNILAIGTPYDTMEVAILDAEQNPLPDGTPGEIALSGPQLAIGYFASPDQTADRFRMIRGKRWYLTGDLGSRDADGIFHHLGRTDNQVKVKGNRIELEEVEMHLRKAAGSDLVAAVAWPVEFGSAQGLVGFVAGTEASAKDIQDAMLRSLPRYMVPGSVRVLDALPVNINGKVDRKALFASLEAANADTPARKVAAA